MQTNRQQARYQTTIRHELRNASGKVLGTSTIRSVSKTAQELADVVTDQRKATAYKVTARFLGAGMIPLAS